MTPMDSTQDSFATRGDWNLLIEKLFQPEAEPKWRRQHRRYGAQGEIRATCMSEWEPKNHSWDLRQISGEGLTAGSPQEVPEDTLFALDIRVNDQTIRAKGRVKHSTQTIGCYKVGIELVFDDE
jgi:hypothetical protein